MATGVAPITPGSGVGVAVDIVAENLTGTVSKAGTTTLTGSSTLFTSELVVGGVVRVPGTTTEDRIISAIASDTSLTVSVAFVNTASGQTGQRVSEVQKIKEMDPTAGSAIGIGVSTNPKIVRNVVPTATTVALSGPGNGVWGTAIDCRGYQWIVLRVTTAPSGPNIAAYGSDTSGGTYDQACNWIIPDATNGTVGARGFAPGTGYRFAYLAAPPPFLEIRALFGGTASAVTATLELYPFPGPTVLNVPGDAKSYLYDVNSGSPATMRGTYTEDGAPGRLFVSPSTRATVLLSAVTATGAGTAKNFDSAYSSHGLQVVLTGAPTAAIVTLQGSLDGTNWITLTTWDAAVQTGGDLVWADGKPVSRVRANLTTLTGGTSPTVTATWVATPTGSPASTRGTRRPKVASAGLTTATTAYTVGDQVGTIFTYPGAARVAGGTGIIQSVTLVDKSAGGADYRLHFFRASVTLAADNAVYSISDADMDSYIGSVVMPTLIVYGGGLNKSQSIGSVGLGYDCAATSLFMAIETRTANAVFAAVTDLVVTLHLLLD